MQKNRFFDVSLRPVNSTAARVVSRGVHYDSSKKIVQRHWDVPPPVRPVPKDPSLQDLTGVKFGRFTVLGFYAEGNGLWVVRCACGDYETRRTKSIKNPNNDQDRCENCRQLVELRRRAEFIATGKNKA